MDTVPTIVTVYPTDTRRVTHQERAASVPCASLLGDPPRCALRSHSVGGRSDASLQSLQEVAAARRGRTATETSTAGSLTPHPPLPSPPLSLSTRGGSSETRSHSNRNINSRFANTPPPSPLPSTLPLYKRWQQRDAVAQQQKHQQQVR